MSRPHAVLLPVLLFLALALPMTAHWSALGDEGGTFNQAMGPARVSANGSTTTPFASLLPVLNNERDYGVGDVLEAMRNRGMHPPGYYVSIHLWTRVFGTSPIALRLPGILLGVLAILGIWAVTREILPEGSAAIWAASVLAVSVNHLYFSIYLRPYALALTLMIGSLWLLLRLRTETSPRREVACWAGFVTVSLLGIYTLYHYVFLLAWQFGVLALQGLLAPKASRTLDLAKLVGAGLVLAAGFAPWLGSLAHHMELTATRRFYFQGFPEAGTWLANTTNLVRKLVIGAQFPGLGLMSPLAELALLTAAILCWPLLGAGPTARRRDMRIFWLSLPLLPAGILLADYLRVTHTLFLIKTMLVMLPLAIVALAVGAKSLSVRALGTACLVLWFAIFLAASTSRLVKAVTLPTWQERVAQNLRSLDRDDHVVVVSSQNRRFLHPLLMTLRDSGVEHLELIHAGNPELEETLPRLLRDPEVEAVSLVSFGDDEGWFPAALKRAMIQSRTLGWRSVPNGLPALISLEPIPPRR